MTLSLLYSGHRWLKEEIFIGPEQFPENVVLDNYKVFVAVNGGVIMVNVISHFIAFYIKLLFAAFAYGHVVNVYLIH